MASAVRKTATLFGTPFAAKASTPREKAMSVDMGMAQPLTEGRPPLKAK